jgi:hypothetical protein
MLWSHSTSQCLYQNTHSANGNHLQTVTLQVSRSEALWLLFVGQTINYSVYIKNPHSAQNIKDNVRTERAHTWRQELIGCWELLSESLRPSRSSRPEFPNSSIQQGSSTAGETQILNPWCMWASCAIILPVQHDAQGHIKSTPGITKHTYWNT